MVQRIESAPVRVARRERAVRPVEVRRGRGHLRDHDVALDRAAGKHDDDEGDAQDRAARRLGVAHARELRDDDDDAAGEAERPEASENRRRQRAEDTRVPHGGESRRSEEEGERGESANPQRECERFGSEPGSDDAVGAKFHHPPFSLGSAVDPLDGAVLAAREAGALLLERFDAPRDLRQKGLRGDLVTDADRAAEHAIVARLSALTPQAAILGEEGGTRPGTSDERWVVDPLDGTTNYLHRYPMFCVSIAYERAGELEAAAIYAPVFDELFAARRGEGATLNGRPLHVSTIASVADAMVCTGFHPARYARNGAHFAHLSNHAQAVRRDGSAALNLAYVAAGRFDAFWEFDLHPWDVAAGALIVREAGGRVERIDEGAPFGIDGASILATNARVHDEMRRELAMVSLFAG